MPYAFARGCGTLRVTFVPLAEMQFAGTMKRMAATTGFWERQRMRLLERALMQAATEENEPEHLATGRRGELAAYFFLRRSGYTIVARGWRSHICPGDLDLIAWDGDRLCVVEVKTRTTRDVATAEASVDYDKQSTLRRLTRRYLRQSRIDESAARFDVVSVYLEPERAAEITLIRDAFGWLTSQ